MNDSNTKIEQITMKDNNTKILVIGDADDVHLIQESLKTTDTQIDITNKDSLEPVLNCLANNTFDSIILDTNLLDKFGLETLKNIVTKFPDIPIVTLLTDKKNKDVAIGSLKIQDYILKEDIIKETGRKIISHSIKRAIEIKKITEALKESEKIHKHITETAIEKLWIIDKEGDTSYVSAQIAQKLGYNTDEII
jgi:DNA-binding NarL/FixJ family response regulator